METDFTCSMRQYTCVKSMAHPRKTVRQNGRTSLKLFITMKSKEKIQIILCDSRQATQKIMYNGGV